MKQGETKPAPEKHEAPPTAEELASLTALLTCAQPVAADGALLALEAESQRSTAVYAYFDLFASLLTSAKSYERTRGARLLCANARWDAAHRLDGVLPTLLRLVLDEKPITARQCIQRLPWIAQAQPHLAAPIREALENADFSAYRDSMRPLLEKDRRVALDKMAEIR